MTDSTIESVVGDGPHYEPFGWHQWPEYPWMSYQFRRALGETQEGGGSVSECFLAASRMTPGDPESWHREWLRVADANFERGVDAEATGQVETARNCWLRATNYYRSAEFWLASDDPRRMTTFDRCEQSFQRAGQYFDPPIEVVEVPYEDSSLSAYFITSPVTAAPGPSHRQPVLIAFGGVDSFKDELLFMVGSGALRRGISCLLVDGPGQGASLRRRGIVNRYDYEVPVAACIDYLLGRGDVDPGRIALSGTSLGGYYAARAAAFEHRLAAVVSHGAIWSITDFWGDCDEDYGLAGHMKWVFGTPTVAAALEKGRDFTLEGILGGIACPYLIVHGGHDVLGVQHAQRVYDEALAAGVDVTLRFMTPDETGAEHCQHDNPTLGEEIVGDFLTAVFGIDQRQLVGRGVTAP